MLGIGKNGSHQLAGPERMLIDKDLYPSEPPVNVKLENGDGDDARSFFFPKTTTAAESY
jgi:hypothetical protein